MTTPPLFRAQALQARAESELGTVRIGIAPSLRWLALTLVVAAALVFGWAALASFTRTLSLPGTLRPVGGLIVLRAGVHGHVLEVPTREGQALPDGGTVAVVDALDAPPGETPSPGAEGSPVAVTAPRPARVSALAARPGQPVTPSTVIAHLEPAAAAWQAELTAPAFALGALTDGRPLRLRLLDAAGSDPVWLDGRVVGVGREPQRAHDTPDASAAAAGPGATAVPAPPDAGAPPFYRVTVAIDGAAADLRSGLRVQAVLPLEQQRLLGWLFGAGRGRPGAPAG